jgi:membrane-associated phospholipid phosphatase
MAFFAFKKFRWNPWLLSLYPAAVWFSAVYLNHHYVIDLIIGGLYVVAAYFIVIWLVYPRVFARFIEPRPAFASTTISVGHEQTELAKAGEALD